MSSTQSMQTQPIDKLYDKYLNYLQKFATVFANVNYTSAVSPLLTLFLSLSPLPQKHCHLCYTSQRKVVNTRKR